MEMTPKLLSREEVQKLRERLVFINWWDVSDVMKTCLHYMDEAYRMEKLYNATHLTTARTIKRLEKELRDLKAQRIEEVRRFRAALEKIGKMEVPNKGIEFE